MKSKNINTDQPEQIFDISNIFDKSISIEIPIKN